MPSLVTYKHVLKAQNMAGSELGSGVSDGEESTSRDCEGLYQSEGLLVTRSTVGALTAPDPVPGVGAFLPPWPAPQFP